MQSLLFDLYKAFDAVNHVFKGFVKLHGEMVEINDISPVVNPLVHRRFFDRDFKVL